jgi:hypothetical protein
MFIVPKTLYKNLKLPNPWEDKLLGACYIAGKIFNVKEEMSVKFEMISIIISCIKRCNKREATATNMNIKIIITVITVTTILSFLWL